LRQEQAEQLVERVRLAQAAELVELAAAVFISNAAERGISQQQPVFRLREELVR
jgi:hypothetical protein